MDEKKIIELHKEIFKNISNLERNKAQQYCSRNLVKDLEVTLEQEVLHLSACVHSKHRGNSYDVGLEIDLDTGEVLFNDCECQEYFLSYTWNEEFHMCKHILAVFLKYEEEFFRENKEKKINDNKKAIQLKEIDYGKILLKSLENNNLEKKELVSLDVFISEFNGAWEVTFKIGGKKKYVLKNLKDFINAKRGNTPLQYGKAFTFDSYIHYFSHDDEGIISFIEEYVDLYQMFNRDYEFYGILGNEFMNNKNLILLDSSFTRFLKCVGNKKITYTIREDSYYLNVKNMDIPLELALTEENDTLVLKQTELLPLPLNGSSKIFIYKGFIYLPSYEQLKIYEPFYKALNKNGKIVFKKEDADEVFNKVLPTINSICEKVNLEGNIEKVIEKSELKLQFYLDRTKENIWCSIKLIYGDINFD